jgi:hypothetical protein
MLEISLSGMHCPQLGLKVALQVMPQEVPSHVALPFAGTGHGSQRLPHVERLRSDAQVLPHRW